MRRRTDFVVASLCFADQDGVRGALLLCDRAHGADRDGRGYDDALLGRQVLPTQALEETAGKKERKKCNHDRHDPPTRL